MKYAYDVNEKDIYKPKTTPKLINLEPACFITITGQGHPSEEAFSQKISYLYQLSYTIKMFPKKGYDILNYVDYKVYPLEGIWDLTEDGRKKEVMDKHDFRYTLMIKQPPFITKKVFDDAMAVVSKKQKAIDKEDIKFEVIHEGLSLQIMHIGSFDEEKKSFDILDDYLKDNNLTRTTKMHKEIYLSDFRKTDKDKLKTILRVWVK